MSNVTEADQPQAPDLDDEKAAEDANKIATTLSRLYLGLLGFGVYLFVTLSVEDAVLVRADAKIDIPVFGITAQLSNILVFAPFCLVALTFYLHLFYGQFLELRQRGVPVSRAFLFTMPGRTARLVTDLIFYAFLPLILAWSSWQALFRPEAPFLVALTATSLVVLALVHQRRAAGTAWPLPLIARATSGLAVTLVAVFLAYASWVGWRGLIENRHIDLVGADLSRADLRRVNLRDMNLTRARLDDADLFDADLRGADLSSAVLQNAELIGANLEGAVLRNADLRGARFERPIDESMEGDEVGPIVEGALTVCGDQAASANLTAADLTGARLTKAVLRNVDLQGSTLTDADLRQADLTCALLIGADLTRANLTRASLREVKGQGSTLVEAKLGKADLRGASLNNADLNRADLDQVTLGPTTFAFSDLGRTSLREWVIEGRVNLIGAKLDRTTPPAAELCADNKQLECVGIETEPQTEGKERASIAR